MQITLIPTREDHQIAWFTALAILIHVFEATLPSIFGIKPGLANIITVCVLYLHGWRLAAWVSILRVLVASLIIGTFLSPTFMLSLSGSLCSLLILYVAQAVPGRGFSAIGVSVLGALAHISGQVICVYLLFIPHPGLWRLYPILLTVALILGLINGIISLKLIKRFEPK